MNSMRMRFLCSLIVIMCAVSRVGIAFAADKPNIIFVLFDDLGYGQPPAYQPATQFKLPNFEQLVREGMRFTDAHSAAAVCTPTRYGILTGRYPARIGQYGVLTTYSAPIIPPERMTVASMLQKEGYHTACIGKWHLGMHWVDGKPGTEKDVPIGAKMTGGPNAVGFDYFYGFTHARNIGSIIEQDQVVEHVEPIANQPRMIRKAIEYIDERAQKDSPFFLYFPMCPPHAPVVPSEQFQGKSGAKDVVGKDPAYGDWVYQGDAMLGQIMAALERNKIAGKTLLIATSDNGAEHREYAPLRASKRSIYEGGHRVPFVARWPGKIKPGSTSEATICLNDFFATAAEIVAAQIPDNAAEDSFSLLPLLLNNSASPNRSSTLHQSSNGDLALREGPWKMIFFQNGTRELYDLEADLSEKQDVLTLHPEIAERLTKLMQQQIDQGRSTTGPVQKNDKPLSITKEVEKAPKKKAA